MKKSDVEKELEQSLKEIIRNEMRTKGKTQAELAEHLCDKGNIIDPSRVSKCLSKESGAFFNLSQLLQTAEFLGCSLDEWIRQQAPSQPAEPEQSHSTVETIADVLQILFDLSDALGSMFRIEMKEGIKYYGALMEPIETTNPVIYLDIEKLDDVLVAWNELQNSKIDEKLKVDVIRTWKKGTLENYKHYLLDGTFFPFA